MEEHEWIIEHNFHGTVYELVFTVYYGIRKNAVYPQRNSLTGSYTEMEQAEVDVTGIKLVNVYRSLNTTNTRWFEITGSKLANQVAKDFKDSFNKPLEDFTDAMERAICEYLMDRASDPDN